MKQRFSLALALCFIYNYQAIPSAYATDNLAIRNIYINEENKLVVEFENPTHIAPVAPLVRDYPGQQHDIVLDFPQTTFLVDKVPPAKSVLTALTKVFPDINSIAYATANDGTKARIRVRLSNDITIHPNLTKLNRDAAIIDLNLPTSTISKNIPDTVQNSAPVIAESKTEPVAETANGESSVSKDGVALKAIHGIKGAWSSSIKASQNHASKLGGMAKLPKLNKINPLAKFGRKQANSEVVSDSTTDGTTVTSNQTTVDKNAPVQTASTEPTATAAPVQTASTEPTATTAPVQTASTEPATTTAPVQTASTEPATTAASVQTASTEPATTTAPVQTATNLPATTTAAPVQTASAESTPASAASAQLEKQASPEIGTNETNRTNLLAMAAPPTAQDAPKTGETIEEKTTEDLITPLPTERVAAEKAEMAKTKQPSVTADNEPVHPIMVKETENDSSVIPDLTTAFSQPKTEPTSIKKSSQETKTETKATDENTEPPKIEALIPPTKSKPNEITSISTTKGNGGNTISGAGQPSETKSTAAASKSPTTKPSSGKDSFPPTKSENIALEHYNKAVKLHLADKLPEAAVEYQAAIAANSKLADAYSNLGLVYNQLHKYDQAMAEFHKALAINPKDAITYNGIGATLRVKGNMVAAKKNWQTAVSLNPNLASAYYNLGSAYELENDLEKALSEYKESVKHDDKLGEAYYRMGLILYKMNNNQLALEKFKQAIKFLPPDAKYAQDAQRKISLLSSKPRIKT